MLVKFVKHGLHRGSRHGAQASHGVAELLHFARAEQLEHLGGMIFTQRNEQGGAFLQTFFRTRRHSSTP